MTPAREVAEAAWRWVLDELRWDDDGPWIPEKIDSPEVRPDRHGSYGGTGGLAYVLAEIRLSRPWTAEEKELADAIAGQVAAAIPGEQDCTFFDGLVSSIGVLTALGAPGVDAAVERLAGLATPTGWPQTSVGPPRYLPDARINDMTLGTAGVLLGALWARRHGVQTQPLAEHAAGVLLTEAEVMPTGMNWPFVPYRFRVESGGVQMPNLSHGLAGVALTLALAGAELDRPDLVAAARGGAEHLISLGTTDGEGFVVPRYLPPDYNDEDEVTYTWCHGVTGTSLLFTALDYAGVDELAGEAPLTWHRRCLHSVRTSGLPQRLHPGFWDNDGRCCGTAGVGEVFLDSWHRSGKPGDLEFALHLADVLVERAIREGPHAYWRFIEHRADPPLLPPSIGWMQGAAGIATFLFHAARAAEASAPPPVPRMDTWWNCTTTP